MPNFLNRSDQIEIMDDLNCQGQVVDQTLHELEVINTLLGGNYVTINGIEKLLKRVDQSKPISIVDLGCGGGDILKLIYKWAKRRNLKVDLLGIDANPNIVHFAEVNSKEFPLIKYKALDIFSDEFKYMKFDIILGTLFFHHFTSPQLSSFFLQAKHQARMGIVVNDVHRNWLAYYSIKFLTKLFSKSEMVQFDAPLSVLRAFKKNELLEICHNAELSKFQICWMWAFRWQVIIDTNND